MFRRFITAAALSAAITLTPAAAATYSFTLNNLTSSDATRVAVKGGEVKGFKRVLAKSSGTFKVDFPDGQCMASRVRVTFANGSHTDHGKYNVCSGAGISVVGR